MNITRAGIFALVAVVAACVNATTPDPQNGVSNQSFVPSTSDVGVLLRRVDVLDLTSEEMCRVEFKLENRSGHPVYIAAGSKNVERPDVWFTWEVSNGGDWIPDHMSHLENEVDGFKLRMGSKAPCELRNGSSIYFDAGVVSRRQFVVGKKYRLSVQYCLHPWVSGDELDQVVVSEPLAWDDL